MGFVLGIIVGVLGYWVYCKYIAKCCKTSDDCCDTDKP